MILISFLFVCLLKIKEPFVCCYSWGHRIVPLPVYSNYPIFPQIYKHPSKDVTIGQFLTFWLTFLPLCTVAHLPYMQFCIKQKGRIMHCATSLQNNPLPALINSSMTTLVIPARFILHRKQLSNVEAFGLYIYIYPMTTKMWHREIICVASKELMVCSIVIL